MKEKEVMETKWFFCNLCDRLLPVARETKKLYHRQSEESTAYDEKCNGSDQPANEFGKEANSEVYEYEVADK
ncbi:MAG: hypothetical protein WC906_02260 [Parcubacteria group bacterium]|jgi:hypothetical protein